MNDTANEACVYLSHGRFPAPELGEEKRWPEVGDYAQLAGRLYRVGWNDCTCRNWRGRLGVWARLYDMGPVTAGVRANAHPGAPIYGADWYRGGKL